MLDLVVIGAGPAGLTAAVYGLRAGLSVLVLEEGVTGGQLAVSAEVENYPSWQKISGWELAEKIAGQATVAGADIRYEPVESIEERDGVKTVVTAQHRYD